jgi:hypothetical protein
MKRTVASALRADDIEPQARHYKNKKAGRGRAACAIKF